MILNQKYRYKIDSDQFYTSIKIRLDSLQYGMLRLGILTLHFGNIIEGKKGLRGSM